MATPFILGCGVAACAMAARGALAVGSKMRNNPEVMKQASAAAAGFKGMGSVFRMPSFLAGNAKAGFEAAMSRREAAKILGIR